MEGPNRTVTTWRKSTYSGGNGSNCVEVAASPESVLIRDTKNRSGSTLAFSPGTWRTFATSLKASRSAGR
jgi:hypothetical protein